jgi:hypothetical protein
MLLAGHFSSPSLGCFAALSPRSSHGLPTSLTTQLLSMYEELKAKAGADGTEEGEPMEDAWETASEDSEAESEGYGLCMHVRVCV